MKVGLLLMIILMTVFLVLEKPSKSVSDFLIGEWFGDLLFSDHCDRLIDVFDDG